MSKKISKETDGEIIRTAKKKDETRRVSMPDEWIYDWWQIHEGAKLIKERRDRRKRR